MKILQISNKIPFNAKDGGAIAIYNLLDGFQKNGVELFVLSMNTSRYPVKYEDIKNEIPGNVYFEQVDIDTRISAFQMFINLLFSRKPYILQRFRSSAFSRAVKKLLTENKFDIIQLECLYVFPYINEIRKYSKARVSYRSHNIEFEVWRNNTKYEQNPFKKFYLKTLANRLMRYEKKMINQYDLLIPISPFDLNFFDLNGNTKPSFLAPFGVNPQDYFYEETEPEINQVSLFFIGSLDWIPNIDGLQWFISNVWKELKTRFPELKFFVAGKNAVKKIKDILLSNDVEFLGEIKDSKPFFLKNTIMIVPLFAGSGMRVKIIEGMAYGKTVVSTSKGAEGILCSPGRSILIADTPISFIENITLLIEDRNSLQRIGSFARQLIEDNYNNELICKQLISFYSQQLV